MYWDDRQQYIAGRYYSPGDGGYWLLFSSFSCEKLIEGGVTICRNVNILHIDIVLPDIPGDEPSGQF